MAGGERGRQLRDGREQRALAADPPPQHHVQPALRRLVCRHNSHGCCPTCSVALCDAGRSRRARWVSSMGSDQHVYAWGMTVQAVHLQLLLLPLEI